MFINGAAKLEKYPEKCESPENFGVIPSYYSVFPQASQKTPANRLHMFS